MSLFEVPLPGDGGFEVPLPGEVETTDDPAVGSKRPHSDILEVQGQPQVLQQQQPAADEQQTEGQGEAKRPRVHEPPLGAAPGTFGLWTFQSKEEMLNVLLDLECTLYESKKKSDTGSLKPLMVRNFNCTAGNTFHNIWRLCVFAGMPLGEKDIYNCYSSVTVDHSGRKISSHLGAPRAPTSKLGTWLRFANGLKDEKACLWAFPDPSTWPENKVFLCVAASPARNLEVHVVLKTLRVERRLGPIKRLLPRCYGGVGGVSGTENDALKFDTAAEFTVAARGEINDILIRTRFGANQSENRKSRGDPPKTQGNYLEKMLTNLCGGSSEAAKQLDS